ncbi:MAG TPA: superoxide dismutase [Opitutaceae bacterium]|nr:superoxide dismutase [Opitutaceae bacterium]
MPGKSTGPLSWDLPALPYSVGALEPHIDAKTMEIHHDKHHATYIANAKKLLDGHPDLLALGADGLVKDLSKVPEDIRTGIRNNAGGHVNHTFFWQILAPATGYEPGKLGAAITKSFGSMETFQTQFTDAALKRFGSGWAWLSLKSGSLVIHSTANQDSPLSEGMTPIVGLDVWEHAYYLKHQNVRANYITAFWKVLNWKQAEANYTAAIV